MFSGIVEEAARVVAITPQGGNVQLTVECSFADELKIDQSVAHNGVCLTVTSIDGDRYTVTAIDETLQRSNLGALKAGSPVNLERSMLLNGRLDGHIVQGHVDCTALCTERAEKDGSVEFTFTYDISDDKRRQGYLTVEKGSVTVNGISLTVCRSEPGLFSVAIIPYTLEHTNLGVLQPGERVNIEFDIIGKYAAALLRQ